MNIYLTFDYELFLLKPPENIDHSLIEPTFQLNKLLNKYKVNATYFVDAGYLYSLNKYKKKYPKLVNDYNKVVAQIKMLESSGNEIGLHIHPHWEDSYYDGSKWKICHNRYKLSDFSIQEANSIVVKYYILLQSLLIKNILSYRAGGWCLYPFSNIRDALLDCGIFIDSSVFHGGYCNNATHYYDFRAFSSKEVWRFHSDPSIIDSCGEFIELPITSYRLSPVLYWKLLFIKVFQKMIGLVFINKIGYAIKPSFNDILRKLFFPSFHAVSVDSLKSQYLHLSYLHTKNQKVNQFNIIGHPKCLSKKSFVHLEKLLQEGIKSGDEFKTISSIIN